MVVGRAEAGRFSDGAVNVGHVAARPAHDMVVVVPDPSVEPGRAAGRFDAAHKSCRREGVQGVIHGLKGDMADAIAHPRGDRLHAEVMTFPQGLEQRDAGGRYPQASATELLGDGRSRLR